MSHTISHKQTITSIPTFSLLLFLVFAVAGYARAETDAGSLLRQQEQLEGQVPGWSSDVESEEPEVEPGRPARPTSATKGGQVIKIKAINFSGAVDLVPKAELQAQISDAIGKRLDFAGLQQIADRITTYLRGSGWLLARAYLPAQDVTSGKIKVTILEGRLDGMADHGGGWHIKLDDGARTDPQFLESIAENVAPSGAVLRGHELERSLLLMNDLPGVYARAWLRPGKAAGSSQAVVEIKEDPLLGGRIWSNNGGNYSTGKALVGTTFDLKNPFGKGNRASLGFTVSRGIKMARLGYYFPIGVSGLRGDLGYTVMHYNVKNGSAVSLDLKGDSNVLRAGLSYPIIRSRKLNIYTKGEYSYKSIKDENNIGTLRDKRVHSINLGFSGNSQDRLGGGGRNNWGLQATIGDLDLSRVASDASYDAATLRTDGRYSKLGWNLSRLQRLPGNFSIAGRFIGQVAIDENLDSSEEFILGGPAGVRAYPVGEAQGDTGWLASLDLRYNMPQSTFLGRLQFSAFVDAGGIRTHKELNGVAISSATGKNSYSLKGVGLGVVSGEPGGDYSVSLTWAHTLGSNRGRTITGANSDNKRDNSNLWLQAVVEF